MPRNTISSKVLPHLLSPLLAPPVTSSCERQQRQGAMIATGHRVLLGPLRRRERASALKLGRRRIPGYAASYAVGVQRVTHSDVVLVGLALSPSFSCMLHVIGTGRRDRHFDDGMLSAARVREVTFRGCNDAVTRSFTAKCRKTPRGGRGRHSASGALLCRRSHIRTSLCIHYSNSMNSNLSWSM